MLQNYRNLQMWNLSVSLFFSLYLWTAFLDFCVFVFVSPESPPLYYFAREHWWYCVTVFLRTDWLNVSRLLFQIWYLANWIFRSLFPNTQGAVTRFNPYLAYGWRAGNLNWPIRIQRAGKILVSWCQVNKSGRALKSSLFSHWKWD